MAVDTYGLVHASAGDADRIAAMLARAFQDDALMRYAVPDARQLLRLLPWLIGLNVRYGCRYGEVWATPDYQGAAVWLPSGQATLTPGRMLRAGMFAAPLRVRWSILRRLAAAGAYATALHEHYAPQPHWYLSQLGVEPARQHQGIGSRLLQPMLARMDADRLPCYLETWHEANLAFYQRHEFAVVAEGAVPGGGPRTWAMLRAVRFDRSVSLRREL
jgi:ribosomal protein S18 acetylase RimI-like enzyme